MRRGAAGNAAIVAMANGCIYFFGSKGAEISVVAEMREAHKGEVLVVRMCDDQLVTSGSDGYIKVLCLFPLLQILLLPLHPG
jgi:hypothetical protein